jgi:hypothetical protein
VTRTSCSQTGKPHLDLFVLQLLDATFSDDWWVPFPLLSHPSNADDSKIPLVVCGLHIDPWVIFSENRRYCVEGHSGSTGQCFLLEDFDPIFVVTLGKSLCISIPYWRPIAASSTAFVHRALVHITAVGCHCGPVVPTGQIESPGPRPGDSPTLFKWSRVGAIVAQWFRLARLKALDPGQEIPLLFSNDPEGLGVWITGNLHTTRVLHRVWTWPGASTYFFQVFARQGNFF